VGPRAKFVPSVSHPTEVASYTSTYDAKASEAWLNLVGLTAGSEPREDSLLLRSRIMKGDGGSGLVYMQDSAPNSLVASVKDRPPAQSALPYLVRPSTLDPAPVGPSGLLSGTLTMQGDQ
jgi:hypothetical protein